MTLNRANVLGVGVHAVNLAQAAEIIALSAAAGEKGYVCVTGVHGVMEAQRKPNFKRILDNAALVVPDGIPTVWIGRLQGNSNMDRVFGPDLMLELCKRTVDSGLTHFLYGGKPGVAEELKNNLEHWFPGIRVVGTYTPPFRPLFASEKRELRNALAVKSPDILWVGLSTPKQEEFMAENLHLLNCKIMIGVGAAFDIHTGRVKDAPQWVKSAGFQWFHRLCQEPNRLWRRYLRNNSEFIYRMILQFMKVKRYTLASPSGTGD